MLLCCFATFTTSNHASCKTGMFFYPKFCFIMVKASRNTALKMAMFYSKLSYHYGSSVQSFNFNDGHALFLTFVPFSIMQCLNSRRLMCDLFNRILILVTNAFVVICSYTKPRRTSIY